MRNLNELSYEQLMKRAETAERRADELAAHIEQLRHTIKENAEFDMEEKGFPGQTFENFLPEDYDSTPTTSLATLRAKHWREAADFADRWSYEPIEEVRKRAGEIERGEA